MGTMIRMAIMVVAIGACVYFSIQMPWAENQMESAETAMPHTLKLFYVDKEVSKLFDGLYASKKPAYSDTLTKKKAEGPHGEYVYAWAMGLALLAGAISIMAIGSDEEQEKTLLPQKQ